MGTRDSVRAVPDNSISVDRSFFYRSAIPLSDRSGAPSLFAARHRRDRRCRNLFSDFSAPLCFSAPAREWLGRRALRLVSRDGRALQSCALTARCVLGVSPPGLYSSHARFSAGRGNYLDGADRTFARAHISTSYHRHHRWIRSGCLLLLPLWRIFGTTASDRELPNRSLLFLGRVARLDNRYDFQAVGRLASLAEHRSRYSRNCLFRSRSSHFSQKRWSIALEFPVCVRSLFVRPIFIAAALPAPMSIMG